MLPAWAHTRTEALASKATTRMWAPVSNNPAILDSPTGPAPTTRHRLPVSFKNMGNKLVTNTSRGMRNGLRQIADDRRNGLARKKLSQLGIAVPGEKATQIFSRSALCEEAA